jgi:cytochrome c oxidase subunit II
LAPPRTLRLCIFLAGAHAAGLVGAGSAAANVISPESAQSPNAEDATTLYWIGLVVILALIAAVNVALLLVIRRYRSERGRRPRQLRSRRGPQLRAAGALGLLALALLVVSIVLTESARKAPQSGAEGLQASNATFAQRSLSLPSGGSEPLRIDATGQQWLWRYAYPNGAFSYYELVVPVDTTVVLDLLSTDVVHTWFVPELAGKFDAVPGKLNRVFFRADEEGVYEGRSATFSGPGYAAMRTAVRVVPVEEYESFVDDLKRDIEAAQQAVAEQIAEEETP